MGAMTIVGVNNKDLRIRVLIQIVVGNRVGMAVYKDNIISPNMNQSHTDRDVLVKVSTTINNLDMVQVNSIRDRPVMVRIHTINDHNLTTRVTDKVKTHLMVNKVVTMIQMIMGLLADIR